MMYILGIDNAGFDTSAALIGDGKVIFAVGEERLNREKRTKKFPILAVRACLDHAGITLSDLHCIAVGWNPAINLERFNSAQSERARYLPEFLYSVPAYLLQLEDKTAQSISQEMQLGDTNVRIRYVDHHVSHAAGAFFPSPFDRAAILSVDAFGEKASNLFAHGENSHIDVMRTIDFPHSLGMLYATFTEFLGFRPDSDEWKVMGAAPYGLATRYYRRVHDMLSLKKDGEFEIDESYFNYHLFTRSRSFTEKFIRTFGNPRNSHEKLVQRHFDIAAALQAVTEEACFHMLRWLAKRTGAANLCVTGGVFMNSVMNGKITASTPFERLYIPSAADDCGTSLGAALYVYHQDRPRRKRHPINTNYFGPGYSNKEIENELRKFKFPYTRVDKPEKSAARSIADGKIVGWFQGRLEFGQRALGNRSILCDPRDPEMKERVNAAVKYREWFRPFAPSILEEHVDEYFAHAAPTPFMEKVFNVNKDKRKLIPAVTHVDGSGRLQTVSRKQNPLFHRLIKEFARITGIPVLLNTSFNLNGEPIVCSPADAIRTFITCGMDELYIGNFLVAKSTI